MNTIFKNRATVGAILLVIGLFVGGSVVYASVATLTTFKVKENKMFFNLVPDNNSVIGEGETVTLPSSTGRTGQLYTYKAIDGTGGRDPLIVQTSSGDTLNGSVGGTAEQVGGGWAVTYIGDEANHTWWTYSHTDRY